MKKLLTTALLFLAPTVAQAQLGVSIALERTSFIKHEAIIAVVTVRNLAGKDVALGGPGEIGWLQINIERSDGTSVLPTAGGPKADTTMLKEGAAVTRRINVTNFFPLEEPGSYLLSCSAYFPGLQRWLNSENKMLFRVGSPRAAFWERTIGVPSGHPAAGHYRRYKLFTGKSSALTPAGSAEVQLLYLSISDEETEDNIVTFALGPILTYRDPQATTDRTGNLCVLYMSGPQMYQYVSLDVDGAVLEDKAYKPVGDAAPQLMQAKAGNVSVRGGALYDAIAEEDTRRTQQKQLRSLSDRPKP